MRRIVVWVAACSAFACGAPTKPEDGGDATGGNGGAGYGGGGGGGVASGTGGSASPGGSTASGGGGGGVTGGTGTGGASNPGGAGGASPSSGGSGISGTGGSGISGTGGNGIGAMGGDGSGGTSAGAGGTLGGNAGGGAGGVGGTGMAGAGGDRCDVAVYNASDPPAMLTLSGSLGAHDPALIFADGRYYEFATGLGAKTSTDLLSWQNATAPARPSWVTTQVPGVSNLWAPDIAFFGGMYHLYYAGSTFGSNRSCIGHMTRASMASGAWADQGQVICSNVGTNDNWNAIDPNVIVDETGQPWLDFGSFWSGIKMIRLDMTGARMGTELLSLANRPSAGGALEGPFIVRRCGYYYLFVSFDHCCDSPWNYNIRVGRSASVTGPYIDKAGTQMSQGGGTLLVTGNATLTAPGHNAIIFTATGAYNVYHALNASHGGAALRVAEIAWDAEGWPVSAGP